MQKTYGANDPSVAKCLDNLGTLAKEQGNKDVSEKYFQQAALIRQTETGNSSVLVQSEKAESLTKMASLYRQKGEFEKAEPLLKEALSVTEHSSGVNSENSARALNNLAMLNRELGNFSAAEPLYRTALKIRQKLNTDPEQIASSYDDLGSLFMETEKYDLAGPMFEKGLELRLSQGQSNPKGLQTSYNNLAELARDKGDIAKAIALAKQALAVAQQQNNAENDVAISMNNLALLYKEQGDIGNSEELFKQLVLTGEKDPNRDPVSYANNLNNLARLYRDEGKLAEAEPLYKKSLALREQSLGPQSAQVGATLRNYAILLRELNKADEAKAMDKRAEAIEGRQ